MDGWDITNADVRRCHHLLDELDVPRVDDHGNPLSLKWRLVHLTAESRRIPQFEAAPEVLS